MITLTMTREQAREVYIAIGMRHPVIVQTARECRQDGDPDAAEYEAQAAALWAAYQALARATGVL